MNSRFHNTEEILRSRSNFWIYIPFILAAVLIGGIWGFMGKPEQPAEPQPTDIAMIQPQNVSKREITLFYPTQDLMNWTAEKRGIAGFESPRMEIRRCLEELFKGPMRDGRRILGQQITLRDVMLDSTDIAFIDLNCGEKSINLGGVNAENAAIESVLKSVQINFPGIKGVHFLKDGQETDVFAGHLDISKPFELESQEKPDENF